MYIIGRTHIYYWLAIQKLFSISSFIVPEDQHKVGSTCLGAPATRMHVTLQRQADREGILVLPGETPGTGIRAEFSSSIILLFVKKAYSNGVYVCVCLCTQVQCLQRPEA